MSILFVVSDWTYGDRTNTFVRTLQDPSASICNFPKFLWAIYTRVTITYNHSIRNKNAPCVERGLKGWAGLAKGQKSGYHLNSMVRSWDLEWGNIMKHWGLMKHSDLMWWKLRIHGFWWVLYGFVQIWSITNMRKICWQSFRKGG